MLSRVNLVLPRNFSHINQNIIKIQPLRVIKPIINHIQPNYIRFYSDKPRNNMSVIKKYDEFPLELLIENRISWNELHNVDKLVLTGQVVFYTPFIICGIMLFFWIWLVAVVISFYIIAKLVNATGVLPKKMSKRIEEL
jgi:hypothetical protein